MKSEELKGRTRAFALKIIRLTEALPKGVTTSVIGKQLLRCGTSVGANYRAACRAKSRADFIAKMSIMEEECDETLYWMELLMDTGIVTIDRLNDLIVEADELLSIAIASQKTARGYSR